MRVCVVDGQQHRAKAIPLSAQMDWSSYFCARCCDGGELLECDGVCLRAFHVGCLLPRERPRPSDPPETPWCAPKHGRVYAVLMMKSLLAP